MELVTGLGIITILSLFILLLIIMQKHNIIIILDPVIPFTAIFCPSLFIYFLDTKNISWFEKFGCVILIHIFVLIPLMYYWSKHLNWYNDRTTPFNSWKSPKLYLDLSIGMIYPMILVVYLSIIRYLRLGNEIDIINIIILFVFLWSFILP